MGKMQRALGRLLCTVGTISTKTLPLPTAGAIAMSEFKNEVEHIYRMLGGTCRLLPLDVSAPGIWNSME